MSDITSVEVESAPLESKTKRTLKIIGLCVLFFTCLFVFTLTKLPETKTTSLMQGYLQLALDPYGIYITDQGREFSPWRGFRYKMIQPTIELSDQTRIEFDEITASPKLLSLLMAKPGADIELKQGVSIIQLSGAGRGDQVDVAVKFDQVNFGKLGILNYFAQIKGSGILSGDFKVAGALSNPKSLNGGGSFTLKSIQIDEQSIMGFPLEAMRIAEGVIEFSISEGKIIIKTFQLGKPGSADDLNLQVTGDMALNQNVNASVMNLRTVIGISDRVKQKLSMLDTLFGNAKQADARYAYKLTGQLSAPSFNPDPK